MSLENGVMRVTQQTSDNKELIVRWRSLLAFLFFIITLDFHVLPTLENKLQLIKYFWNGFNHPLKTIVKSNA